jgi:hypothetical protein
MTKLGFVFSGDKSNYDITKEWCNSTHSCIKYAKAFGSYLFSQDRFDAKGCPRGTLEDMNKMYQRDKEDIEKIAYTKYTEKFGRIDVDEFDFKLLLSKLKGVETKLIDIDPKQKSMVSYNSVRKTVKEIIEEIQNKFEVK